MGLVGLFAGPVLMALLVAMWREWLHEAKSAGRREVLGPNGTPENLG